MSDEEEENNAFDGEEFERLTKEIDSWKAKYKSLEIKKRESDLALNKIKTEINSLRSVDKLWKEASKTVFLNLNDVKNAFDVQVDQVLEGLGEISKGGERVTSKATHLRSVKKVIAQLQSKIAKQDETIVSLNARIRNLTAELQEKTDKVARLSQGIEEEVERLIKPIREKLSETVTVLMKEKASRAQERRELADLWPKDHMMPTLLMRYRSFSKEEMDRRIQYATEQNANASLALEIRANVVESQMWEIKYDDYGRAYYQHMKTAQILQEPPEIMNYKPPPGRDEYGNLIETEENDANNWIIGSDTRGQVYYRHKLTNVTTYYPPFVYKKIPPGKTREQTVAEAASIVLDYIKEKISKHIAIKKKRKEELENPLTPEEKKKKEKKLKNRTPEEIAADGPELTEEGEPVDLNLYQYDIETVELLAHDLLGDTNNNDKDMEVIRKERRSFLEGSEVRKFQEDLFEGQTIVEFDLETLSIQQLRGIVEELAQSEEKYESKLARTRNNLKDFSFVLSERIAKEQEEKIKALKEEKLTQEKELKAQQKQLLAEKKAKLALRKEQYEKEKQNSVSFGDDTESKLTDGRSDLDEDEDEDETTTVSKAKDLGSISELGDGEIGEGEDPKKLSPEEGESEMKGNNEKNESGSVHTHKTGKSSKTRGTTASKSVTIMPFEEEDREIEQLEKLVDAPIIPVSDEELEKEIYGDKAFLLFGEIKVDQQEYDCSEDLQLLTNHLCNYTLFSGFLNLNVANYPYENNNNYSILEEIMTNHSKKTEDDEWLSAHFYLGCTKEQLENHRDLLKKEYDARTGFLPIGPFDIEKIVYYSRTTAEVDREVDHSYTPLTRSVTETIISKQHELWKTEQLVTDIMKTQIQQQAIQSLLCNRIRGYEDSQYQQFDLQTTQVHLNFNNIKLKLAKKFTNVMENVYCIQYTIGPFSKRTKGINVIPSEILEWYEMEIQGTVGINVLQIDTLIVEIIDENPTNQRLLNDGRSNVIIAKGMTSLNEVLGANIGRATSFEVKMMKTKNYRKSFLRRNSTASSTIGDELTSVVSDHKEGDASVEVIENPNDEVNDDGLANEEGEGKAKSRRGSKASKGSSGEILDPNVLGFLQFQVKGEFRYQTVLMNPIDPQGLENHNDLLPPSKKITKIIDVISPYGQYKIASEKDVHKFRLLVSELRGDDWNLSKKLTGDYPIDRVLALPQTSQTRERGNSTATGSTTMNSIPPKTKEVSVAPIKKLPNFENAVKFLNRQWTMHDAMIRKNLLEIKEQSQLLAELMKTKTDSIQRQLGEIKAKVRRALDQTQDVQKEVQKYQKLVTELRKPNPEPKEPVFPELPPIPYIPQLPASGGLDSRGKKKKQLPPNELKSIIENVDTGVYDGIEIWPLPDSFFPSQAQAIKIGKSVEQRNAFLDAKRANEIASREKLLETYQLEHDKWEILEKRRLNELEKTKKDCRKVNVKYDCAIQRLQRLQEENSHYEADIQNMTDLKALQEKSLEQSKVIRLKQQLELQRQIQYIQQLKKRLLRAVNARRYALEYPKTAVDQAEYIEYQRQSEEALRLIKTEILECKHLLHQEGVRLRTLFFEEESYLKQEITRINVSIEIIQQRDLFDQIISRYKTDILVLMMELEKCRLAEAEKDETGIDTVDDLGERYLPSRQWQTAAVVKVQRAIDLAMAKIKTTEMYGRSAGSSQKHLISIIASQYGEYYFTLKDSWTELSDFDRGQRALQDTIQYLKVVRHQVQEQVSHQTRPYQELSLQYQLMEAKTQDSIFLHEQETKGVKESALIMLDAVRKYLADYRSQSEDKINHLETSIVQLSRECQKIREELLSQQMVYDDKMKVLWAFIHTLQTALQQMSARMEIVLEEREKVVIESRLMADNTRHQLRQERRHCSHLLFIIHSQRGFIHYLKQVIHKQQLESQKQAKIQNLQRTELKRDVWETVFTFTRLCTDVDLLFEFFATRLANLSGARDHLNDALARNNAAMVLASLCKNPRPVIRRNAARALGNMGWNGFIETRILLWDCIMYWKTLKKNILSKENIEFEKTLQKYNETNKYDAILITTNNEMEEFVPSGNISLRSIIKQRRQWALRAARRVEGPNVANQKLLNIKDGVLIALLDLCVNDGGVDWEISRNAALAISIASYEKSNHADMVNNQLCIQMILQMCQANDVEVQTHAAITIANLCYKDETAQMSFGKSGIVPVLIDMLSSSVADVLEASTAALANLTCYCDANCYQVIQLNGIHHLINVIIHSYSENLLDLDQNDEVHANAAETLANISRFNTKESIQYFLANSIRANNSGPSSLPTNNPALPGAVGASNSVIDALVIMCASMNKQLKRHVALVIGNIAQHEKIREEIGGKGGIESLFLTLEDSDIIVQSNALWALANLMWYPPNQERAGRFMKEIVDFIYFDYTRAPSSRNTPATASLASGKLEIENGNDGAEKADGENKIEVIIDDSQSLIDNQSQLTGPSTMSVEKNTAVVSRKKSRSERKSSIGRRQRNASIRSSDIDLLPLLANGTSGAAIAAGGLTAEAKEKRLVQLLKKNHHPEQVVINATMLLGNVLYYNTNNRIRFLEIPNALEILFYYIQHRDSIHVKIIESSLRSLLSLSYLDSIALYFGTEDLTDIDKKETVIDHHLNDPNNEKKRKTFIPLLISYLAKPYYSRDSMRYALEILCNLCLHHLNRQIIFDYQGIDAIVSLHTDEDSYIRELSMKIIDYLEDITPKEIIARQKALIGLERMVTMVTNPDPLVRTIAAEAIGEEIWNASQNNHLSLQDTSDPFYNVQKKPTMTVVEKQKIAHEIGAIDSLLSVVQLCNQHFARFVSNHHHTEEQGEGKGSGDVGGGEGEVTQEIIQQDIQSLLPTLWSLRNTIHQYYPGQTQFYFCNGVTIVCQLIRNINTGFYLKETEKLLEGAVSLLISAVSNSHEKNSRKLVMIGLDAVLDLTKESTILKQYHRNQAAIGSASASSLVAPMNQMLLHVVQAIQSESLQALVNSLLLALGPYNYVICKNCQRKQDLHGTSCYYCGHRLLVDVQEIPPLLSTVYSEKQLVKLSQMGIKDAPAWRHAGKSLQVSSSTPVLPVANLNAATAAVNNNTMNGNNAGTMASELPQSLGNIKGGKSYFSRTLPVKMESSGFPTGAPISPTTHNPNNNQPDIKQRPKT